MSNENQPIAATPEVDIAAQPAAIQEQPPRERRPRTSRGQQRRRQKSVFQYVAILFAAAFTLLLFTYMMERRENQEQLETLQQSVSAVQSLENLVTENTSLKGQLDALETASAALTEKNLVLEQQLQAAQQETDALANAAQAMDWFWQIDEAYVREKYSLCRSLIKEIEEAGLVDSLPQESVTDNQRFSPADRYQEIYNRVF